MAADAAGLAPTSRSCSSFGGRGKKEWGNKVAWESSGKSTGKGHAKANRKGFQKGGKGKGGKGQDGKGGQAAWGRPQSPDSTETIPQFQLLYVLGYATLAENFTKMLERRLAERAIHTGYQGKRRKRETTKSIPSCRRSWRWRTSMFPSTI